MLSERKQNFLVLFVSIVSFTEVLSYPAITPTEMNTAKNFLQEFLLIPFNETAAEQAAYFRRMYGLNFPDATIAATAFAYKIPLVTRDKQFKKIREIAVVKI